MLKVLHNAFDAEELQFEAGKTVRAIDGREFDEESFCRVLATALRDKRFEMNWTFAARLVE